MQTTHYIKKSIIITTVFETIFFTLMIGNLLNLKISFYIFCFLFFALIGIPLLTSKIVINDKYIERKILFFTLNKAYFKIINEIHICREAAPCMNIKAKYNPDVMIPVFIYQNSTKIIHETFQRIPDKHNLILGNIALKVIDEEARIEQNDSTVAPRIISDRHKKEVKWFSFFTLIFLIIGSIPSIALYHYGSKQEDLIFIIMFTYFGLLPCCILSCVLFQGELFFDDKYDKT